MKMIAFTLCSNNYLPMARVLGESMLRHNPQVRFIIGLVDSPDPAIDYKALGPFEVIPANEIGIPKFEEMVLRYSIVELNTAVKPFYFRYLLAKYPEEKDLKVCYFDPDICVYASLAQIEQSLETSAIVLTPHTTAPIALDTKHPGENTFLNFGLYNLGFCGVRRSQAAEAMLNWWAERLAELCRNDVANGIFVDQLWINLVPLFFTDVEISRHPGLNVAYWNLHERKLQFRDGQWHVNGQWPLVFFHFSNLAMNGPSITKVPTRFTLDDLPELKPLFEEYRAKLEAYKIAHFSKLPCAYVTARADWLREQRKQYYRKHPTRLLVAGLKRAVPQQVKAFIRGS